eukprot:7917944-Pyramimonas_sp.AAC.1
MESLFFDRVGSKSFPRSPILTLAVRSICKVQIFNGSGVLKQSCCQPSNQLLGWVLTILSTPLFKLNRHVDYFLRCFKIRGQARLA